jgi:acyl transferase domain-containing protein
MSTENNLLRPEPIAIVGIGCRFPRADNPEQFWALLVDGIDAITEVPPSRFEVDAFYDPAPGTPGKMVSRFGGFIGNIDLFDASFFGTSPREAEAMDPQQRILLEVACEALEDAGLPANRSALLRCGVFVGMMSNDYLHRVYRRSDELDLMTMAGNARGTAAARISHILGCEGPSLVVDADRASSLAALHLACESLHASECSVAIAGACNLILSPELSIASSRSGLLSPDGRCKFCDASADGIGRSEGFGLLVLKRLADAICDNDRIYALIRGSAVTANGKTELDLTRPSAAAQESLIRGALRDACVHPDEVLYVEAHGTGTPRGDEAEVNALGKIFGESRPADRPCLIGSVKTNIGHAEAAAGMAGVIKVALALHHGLLPRSLHLKVANPKLAIENRNLRVQAETVNWPVSNNRPGLAGVSSFGFTGTLAHLVLEAAPPEPTTASGSFESRPMLLPISAKCPQSLHALAEAYQEWLQRPTSQKSLARLCYSAGAHREHHHYRLACVGASADELIRQLGAHLEGTEPFPGARGDAPGEEPRRLAFVFPGQGGQWIGMGRELLTHEPVFRSVIETCDEAIRLEAGWSLLALLQAGASDALLEEIEYVQPALTALMMGLAALWRSWGIKPDAVVGFSMGEAAAACVAGILDIREAIAIVCRRTKLMKRLRGRGAIASIPLSATEAEKARAAYGSEISIAAISAPGTTLLSGGRLELKRLVDDLESRGLTCHYVKVDVASHSVQMEGLLNELRDELADLKPRQGSIPLFSTVDELYVTGPELDADYWARNLRQPVLQMNGIACLLRDGYTTFLEVSPHPTAWTPLLETIHHCRVNAIAITSLRRDEGEREALLKSLGALYSCGISPDWSSLFCPEERHFLSLPTYRWQRQRYWLETGRAMARDAEIISPAATAPKINGVPKRLIDELRSVAPARHREALLDHLQRTAAKILKFPDPTALNISAPLREAGLTSLIASEFALELNRGLDYACSATLLFNYPTIEKLTDHLLSEGVLERPVAVESSPSRLELEAPRGGAASPDSNSAALDENEKAAEPVAVIGMGCRFPGGAVTPDQFWQLLRNGVDAVTEVPPDRWNADEFYDPNPDASGKMYTRWGGFLSSIQSFDAGYFGISRREAEVLDPQQRLLLEVAVEALEHAGIAPDPRRGSDAGVFVGIMNNNEFVSVKGISSEPSRLNSHDSTGQATSAAAGRLSYTLGFHGPSVAVDTACSSSLVAIHLACQALRLRECQIAVAGGVNVILAPETTISFCKTRMLSPTGRCKTFDAGADGYVRGEGCGVIVLKRLSDALREQDNILALIRGSAVNQDGRSSSLTAPSGLAQQAVVRRALQMAGVRPSDIDYIEAHGTGTALGDPIELEALGKALGEGRDSQNPFLVGSVKTNIGHLEAAAGVAGLIKVLLSFQHEEIPPHLHLTTINPQISLGESKACIPGRLTPWPRGGKRRLAGVSSFGFVGTNAHLVLEEAPAELNRSDETIGLPIHRLLTLSGRSRESLGEMARQYSDTLSRREIDIDDLCFTANTGRIHHPVRAAFTGSSVQVLREKIETFAGGVTEPGMAAGVAPVSSNPKVGFLFTGQGAQYPGMGCQLYKMEPVFRAAIERCAKIIDPLLHRSIVSILCGDDPEKLQQTMFAQPALFTLEYALLEQWLYWGVTPSVVMGHSLGEYVAAVAARVLSLEDAAKLVVIRGRLMQSIETPAGSAAVFTSEDVVRSFVGPYQDSIAIAADNAPRRVLIAGAEKPLQDICHAIQQKGIEVRRMNGLLAAHSPLMDPILETFENVGATVTYRPPSIPMVSTRTARLVSHAEISDPKHWRNLIRDKVRFREGMQTMYESGCRIFVELGPRHTLAQLAQMCLPFPDVTSLPSLSKEKHDHLQMLESLAELYVHGVPILWENRHHGFAGRKIPLPPTVFERQRFWPEQIQRPSSNQQYISSMENDSMNGGSLLVRSAKLSLEQTQFETRMDVSVATQVSSADGLHPQANGVTALQNLSYEERRDALFDHVLKLVRTVTAMEASEPLALDVPFDMLGLDSLLTLDLTDALNRSLGLDLSADVCIDCPTIELLVDHLFKELKSNRT